MDSVEDIHFGTGVGVERKERDGREAGDPWNCGMTGAGRAGRNNE